MWYKIYVNLLFEKSIPVQQNKDVFNKIYKVWLESDIDNSFYMRYDLYPLLYIWGVMMLPFMTYDFKFYLNNIL